MYWFYVIFFLSIKPILIQKQIFPLALLSVPETFLYLYALWHLQLLPSCNWHWSMHWCCRLQTEILSMCYFDNRHKYSLKIFHICSILARIRHSLWSTKSYLTNNLVSVNYNWILHDSILYSQNYIMHGL